MSLIQASPPPSTDADSLRRLDGGGDMGARMRTLDWRDHPPGLPQT